MSTDTISPATGPARHALHADLPSDLRVTQWGVIRSEWLKFWSLRSSFVAVTVAVVGMFGFDALFCFLTASHWPQLTADQRAGFDPTGTSLSGFQLCQLVLGVLGVLVVSGEYGTGMIRSSMAAAPKRVPVILAKAAVCTAVAFVVAEVASFVSFLAGQALLSSQHIQTTLAAPHVLRAVFGTGLYLTGVCLLGVAVGWLVRNTAGGIVTLLGVLLILPGLVEALPADWSEHILPYLPSVAGRSVAVIQPDPGMLSPWAGFAVLCCYVVAGLVAAAVAVRRRDT
jgi:hypothetical protein